jgi:outer membrane protein
MKTAATIFLCVICLIFQAGPVLADEIVSLKAGVLSLVPEGEFAVGGNSLPGTRIDLEDDLDFDDSEDLYVEAGLNFGPFHLAASYMPISFSGSGPLTRDILFNDRLYNVGVNVESDVDIDLYDIGLTWFLVNLDDAPVRLQIGPEICVKVIDADLSLKDRTNGIEESDSVTAPVPTVGLRARVGLGDWLSLTGRVGYLEYDDNSFTDADAQLEFSPIPFVGVFVGYRYFDLEVDESDVFIDATFDGPYGGVLVRF